MLTKVESSLAQAEGRVRTFGVASGVAACVSDQLQGLLYRLGLAGGAAGVAMSRAGVGITGAAGGAKLLNVALAAGLVGALVAAAVGIGSVVKQAFALDTGLTDVAKTTGFTKTELSELASNLQQVAFATGTPVESLLGLASVAGSLGVTGVDNVTKFTDVINKLQIASDIVGEEGAEQLAKFINGTKEAGQGVGDVVELVDNVIVRLGNELAATEAPILAMAQRLGGLKTTANVSQTDILGLAGAFVSLGISAGLGGTNVQKIFGEMSLAVSRGGADLQRFADALGMTAEAFRELMRESRADAFIAMVENIRVSKDAGEDINPTIQRIADNSQEMRRVILAAVGGIDTFRLAMNSARDESQEMTAMQNELNTRLEGAQGRWDKFVQTLVYARDTLALKLISAISDTITFVDTFTRSLFGLNDESTQAVNTTSVLGGSLRALGGPLQDM